MDSEGTVIYTKSGGDGGCCYKYLCANSLMDTGRAMKKLGKEDGVRAKRGEWKREWEEEEERGEKKENGGEEFVEDQGTERE